MASKDYDDLLESFMNNSAKVYNEDKKSHKQEEKKVPAAYKIDKSGKDDSKSIKRGRVIDKELASGKRKKSKKPRNARTKGQQIRFNIFRVFCGILMVIGVVGIVCFSVIAIYGYSVVHGDAVFDLTVQKYSQNQTSFVYGTDADGNQEEMTRLHGEENRIWVNLDEMSPYLDEAAIAAEDTRFKKHHGVDWVRTIGCLVKPDNFGQGGSTITQQLIKNLTDENQVTFARKFNEILSALNIERHHDKNEIIEAYLNTIYLSEGCYGVKTAAEKYFGKDVSNLNIAECACLVAITNKPTRYDPLRNPDKNRTRQLYILDVMLDEGFIDQQEYDDAVAYEMVFTNSENYGGSQVSRDETESRTNVIDSWYIDFVINTVIDDLQKEGYTYRKAKSMVYGGGLKIYSAIDFEVQEALEDVYENYRRMPDETVQGAMAIMNYEGRVLGIVGGTGKKEVAFNFNRATDAKRQPGSTIKPLSVYGPALEKSLNNDNVDIYWSTLTPDKPLKKIKGKWWPTNEGGSYSGRNVTVQYGLSKSLNTISAQTLDKIGVDYSYNYISNKFHISTLEAQDCDYAPMATGSLTYGVSVLEMTAAYASFGNGGKYYYPYCYYKVTDSQDNVILETKPEETVEQALTESTGWLMNKILQTVMTNGTGTTYKLSNVECFGKTGTTTGSVDRWFIGGTPEYVAATWYGYDLNKEIVYRLSPNPAGTIWKTVMTNVYDRKGVQEKSFPEYDGIVRKAYDPSNGLLARYSSGSYGWYDAKNLPNYSSSTGATRSNNEDDSDNKTNDSGGADNSAEQTAAAESQE